MSNKKYNLFDSLYNSYGEAVKAVLDEKGLPQKWLVKEIIKPDQKFTSLQQQVSRWLRGEAVSEGYQVRINNALDISITRNKDGKWKLSRTEPKSNQLGDPEVQYADSVEIPEDGKLSRDHVKQLLGQIEEIARILKDSL